MQNNQKTNKNQIENSTKNKKEKKKRRFEPFNILNKKPRPKQITAFKILSQGHNLLANLHTSYGKTWLALFLAQKVIDKKKQFIICCPLKAVVDQHTNTFQSYFQVIPISGDYRHHKSELFNPNMDGFIITYEMLYQIIIKKSIRDFFFQQIGGIVFDEFQLITTNRGPILESLIYFILL